MKKYLIAVLLTNYFLAIAQDQNSLVIKKEDLNDEQLKTWYFLDYTEDTIPGISLNKAYRNLIKDKKAQEVIVAVLDTKLDIHHEDLKDHIWINTDEIPNNGVDDDKNGYVDDINGWDFLSNTNGEFLKYQLLERARIVKRYDQLFKGKRREDIQESLKNKFDLYTLAYQQWHKAIVENKENLMYLENWRHNYLLGKRLMDSLALHNTNLKIIDSIIKMPDLDSTKINALKGYRNAFKYEFTIEDLNEFIAESIQEKDKMLNLDFNERTIIGDDPQDIKDSFYGSHIVYGEVPFNHSTEVSGVIAANRNNNIGANGISNLIKIMPIVMVASGDENDKDVALAIRYAVDNGAKVINISWGKYLSSNKDWVDEALKYAAENDVLLVSGAGNENLNNDKSPIYPSDLNVGYGTEFVENLIVVGASTLNINKLKASFSNYGKKNVDTFAPGVSIFSTHVKNEYGYVRGTSFATPIVSGLAALLRANYPKLSAIQIKQIILDSGTPFDIKVEITLEDNSKKMIPFSELSKSGKIVNAYNALIMAEKLSK